MPRGASAPPAAAEPRLVPADRPDPEQIRRHLRRLARLLDASIPVPGTSRKIGLDGLIGLIPGVGDAIGLVLSSYIVAQAARLRVPPSVLARMGLNIGVETVLGAIPLIGDLFDFVWKANEKNVALLEQHVERPLELRRASRRRMWGVAAVAFFGLAAFVAVVWAMVAALVGLFS